MRVAAAKAAGFEGIGLRAETYVDALAEGLHDEDILAILKKYDIAVTEVEYITLWAEDHRSYEQMYKEQICFHMCELFGVNHINCGLMENYSGEYTAQKLRELCRRGEAICLTSDSHSAETVLHGFPQAAVLARSCGFRESMVLTERGFLPQKLP